MREILFRGKRKDNGEWVYGYYSELPIGSLGATIFAGSDEIICEDTASYIISVFSKQHSNFSFGNPLEVVEAETYEVDRETIGQYTGLTDCKGNKIFEGDIIRFADYHEYECYLESLKSPKDYEGVSFENLWTVDEIVYGIKIGYPAFDLNHNDFECNGLAELNCSAQYYYEKIGNIHDKPEPLEMQDD